MKRNVRSACVAAGFCALVALLPVRSFAGTILEMSLGDVSPDIRFDGSTLFTIDDGNGDSGEKQDTSVLFLDFLDPLFTDIFAAPPNSASFSLSGLTPSGSANLIAGSIIL